MEIIEKGKDVRTKDEAIEAIFNSYLTNEVVIGELLETIELRGFSMRDVVSIYAKSISKVEGDKLEVVKEGERHSIL